MPQTWLVGAQNVQSIEHSATRPLGNSAQASALTAALPRAQASSSHEYNWDRLRVVASLDIVGSHLGGEHLFGGVGTPLFMMLAVGLGVQQASPGSGLSFVRKRVQRVLIPWLIWSVAIAMVLCLSSLAKGQPVWSWWREDMWLYGPQIHLWFLPTAAAAGVLAHALHRVSVMGVHGASRARAMRVAGWAFLGGMVALGVSPYVGRGWPYEQWSFSTPALALGFGIGRLRSARCRTPRRTLASWCAAAALAALVLAWALPYSSPLALRYAGALLLLGVAGAMPNASDPITPRLAVLMLGAYILHPLVFQVAVEPALGMVGLENQRWARVWLGFIATLVLVAGLRKTRLYTVL